MWCPAAGVVESVAANLGQPVKKGQLLAVIASSTVSEQRSEFLSAQKRLALAKTTFDREKKTLGGKDFPQSRTIFRRSRPCAKRRSPWRTPSKKLVAPVPSPVPPPA